MNIKINIVKNIYKKWRRGVLTKVQEQVKRRVEDGIKATKSLLTHPQENSAESSSAFSDHFAKWRCLVVNIWRR